VVTRGLGSTLLVTRGLGGISAISMLYLYAQSIVSTASVGLASIFNAGDEPGGRRDRVKGFEHISWIQY